MHMYACTTKFLSVQRLWYLWKHCLFYLSDKHETGSEAEINHVRKNPLLCFWGCHKWNGEWMFLLCCVSHQNWKSFQFINCVARVWGQFNVSEGFFCFILSWPDPGFVSARLCITQIYMYNVLLMLTCYMYLAVN